jgi:hypothetical protein
MPINNPSLSDLGKTARRVAARQIVREIIKDLSDRRGLKQEWNAISPTIQKEIIESWTSIVERGYAR